MKEKATRAGQGAAAQGQRVASTAKEQGRHVAQETGRKTRGVVDQAQAQLQQQAGEQQKRAAGGLHALGEQLRSMADKSDQPGMAADLVHQASGRAHQVADWLEHREPGQVLAEVRQFARRHPGAFLTGAAMAGVLAGRLTRNMAGTGQGDSGVDSQRASEPEPSAAGGPDGYGHMTQGVRR